MNTNTNNLLQNYIPIANFMAETFGKNCEVVIHDLTKPQESVIYVVNSHVTGRKKGQSFDYLIKEVLLSDRFNGDYTANYHFTSKDGKEIKSSTVLIKDENKQVIGAICVNIDIEPYKTTLNLISEYISPGVKQVVMDNEIKTFQNIVEIVDDIIDGLVGTSDVNCLKKTEKISILKFMERKGLFLIKGMVEKAAVKLNISPVTVYSYLDEIRNKKEEE